MRINKMKSRIPEDFGSKFPLSDIVINTLNSKGKKLHTSKMILATYSPYFEAMFFRAEWNERAAELIDFDEDYDVVLQLLRVIYSIHRIGQKPHPPSVLLNLYRFSDKYDFPIIRELCKEELEAQVTCESLVVTAQLGLHDIKSKLLEKMDSASMKKFVDSVENGDETLFTKNDLLLVQKKLAAGDAKEYKALKLLLKCGECGGRTLCDRECAHCNSHSLFGTELVHQMARTICTYPKTSCFVAVFCSFALIHFGFMCGDVHHHNFHCVFPSFTQLGRNRCSFHERIRINKMESRIPEDFGSKFPMSDIVINTLNSKGKKLHASKMILATYSPYFEAMFFRAEWKEKEAESIDLDEDYNVVLQLLRVIYSIHRIGQKPHPPSVLLNLYRVSDKYDFPIIRELCKEELDAQVTCESLVVTAQLGLHDIKSKLFEKMGSASMKKFVDLVDDGNEVLFTKNDLRIMQTKLAAGDAKEYKALKLLLNCGECGGRTLCDRECAHCNSHSLFGTELVHQMARTVCTYPKTSCFVAVFCSLALLTLGFKCGDMDHHYSHCVSRSLVSANHRFK